jgi:hypothetical protein
VFQIPEDLDQFSVSSLQDLAKIANDEYSALKGSVRIETVTNEEIERLEELQGFVYSIVPTEIASREEKATRFAAATAEPSTEEATEEPVAPEGETPVDAVVASTKVTVADMKAAGGGNTEVPEKGTTRQSYSTLVASATVQAQGGSYESGQVLTSMLDVAKVFEARSMAHNSMAARGMSTMTSGPVSSPVAQLVRNYPDEFSVSGTDDDYEKLLKVASESRLPGGSLLASVELDRQRLNKEAPHRDALVAAQGWCAPSETDYDICLQITTDGLYDAPEVQARRGGVRHNTGLEFDTIFGDGSGFFNLTEAQVAAGTTKTCVEIPCPSFTDTRLGVTGLCLTGNILAIRGYPEMTATFTRGAMAASAHQINREQVAVVAAGSTAVSLANQPYTSDGSVVSQVLSAVEMAIVDIKYRLRLQRSSTLEVIMPYWTGAQMRADWVRRNGTGSGPEALTLADSAISSAFAARGARVQYIYDWQDAFSSASLSGGGPGADTPMTELPTSLQFIVYPSGTWVRAVSDVITLNSVYDSTKLATNQVTHLFTETGWAMLKMCPVSRIYTVAICPNGSTGVQRAVTC